MKFQLGSKYLIFTSAIIFGIIHMDAANAQRNSTQIKASSLAKSIQTAQATPDTQQIILYVNPQSGTDSASAGKTEVAPYRTISYALQQATPGTTIQLASGKYNNEAFPLIIKSNVILKGNQSIQGQGVEIIGGGFYYSHTFARQNVTILAQDNAQVFGLTITNPNSRGTGIWIESGQPIISNNTFIDSKREGVFVTGNAAPRIENNRFTNNDANGLSIAKEARGEIRNNIFDHTGFGIAIGGISTPIVSDNQIRGNRNGIVLTDSAHPRLLSNLIEDNRDYGLVIIGQSEPNLDRNTFKGNQKDQFRVSPLTQQTPPE